MIKVRYPNGMVVQYNTGQVLVHDSYGTSIFTSGKITLLAIVQDSAGAIFEWHDPCRVYNETHGKQVDFAEIGRQLKSIRRKLGMRR